MRSYEMYQLTDNPNLIRCLESGALIPRGHRDWPEDWMHDNQAIPQSPPYLIHSKEHCDAIRSDAWMWMNSFIRDKGYDSIESCCSYINSSIDRYKEEAISMIAWRDSVNVALERLFDAKSDSIDNFENAKSILPSPEDFNWPS